MINKKNIIAVDKLFHDFTFNLDSNNLSLEGSDRIALRRGIKLLLEKYSSDTIRVAIENFFIEPYAKNNNFPFRLFLKQIVRYTKAPSVYQLSLNDLINKHFKNPKTGRIYEEITYANDDRELEIIKKLEEGSLGTIYDVSLEDVEKIITKKIYNQGKDSVPSSWTEAYFNRVKIYNTPLLYEKERRLAKEKEREKLAAEKKRKRVESIILDLGELSFLYKEGASKTVKYTYINTKFKDCSEQFKEEVRKCRTPENFLSLIETIRKEKRV